jgi:hypothetical protein
VIENGGSFMKNRPMLNIIFFTCLFAILTHHIFSSEDKWVVITSINSPTDAVRRLAMLPDWNVVIVADKKTPTDWYLEGCHFLSVEKQKSLPYKIVDILPWNHYARKNIGYLYAIEHGAKIIYDTDDDNYIDKDIEYFVEGSSFDLSEQKDQCVNPYHFFGQSTVWPRGYPLEKISMPRNKLAHRAQRNSVNAYIQQGLVDKEPDVDAIFRLTRQEDVFFSDAKPLCLRKHSFAPFNSQNTIFHHQAFWGLLLPFSVSFRVSDIWRGYIAQRLLWDVDGHLCFFKSSVIQYRNEHNLLHDFKDEIDLYLRAGELIGFLDQWSFGGCLYERFTDLLGKLIEKKYYQPCEMALLNAWIEDLITIGYQAPKVLSL